MSDLFARLLHAITTPGTIKAPDGVPTEHPEDVVPLGPLPETLQPVFGLMGELLDGYKALADQREREANGAGLTEEVKVELIAARSSLMFETEAVKQIFYGLLQLHLMGVYPDTFSGLGIYQVGGVLHVFAHTEKSVRAAREEQIRQELGPLAGLVGMLGGDVQVIKVG